MAEQETKWTPGPWRVVVDRVGTKSRPYERHAVHGDMPNWPGMCICTFIGEALPNRPGEIEAANAHLIAAAPELYEALQQIVRIRKPCSDPIQTDQETHMEETCRWCKARAALAKARGEREEGGEE